MTLFINGRFTTQKLTGVQRFATELTQALLAFEGDYTLLTPSGGSASWPGAREIGTYHGQLWEQFDLPRASAGGLLVNLGNTGALLCRKQFVVIHDTGVFATPQAYSKKFRIWYKFLQMMLMRGGAKIVTVSNFSKQEIIRHFPACKTQVSIIPEGSDHMLRIATDTSIIAKHGLEPGRFVLGIGTPAVHKNLSALSNLADLLCKRNMRLVLAGCVTRAVFQAIALPKNALYIGRVTDGELKALYENAGCFVFPSLYEGYGLPPLEAMACGCPVAASDIPVLREICADAAEFFDPSNPEVITSKVMAILDSPAVQKEWREAGLAHAAKHTWADAAAALDCCIKREMCI